MPYTDPGSVDRRTEVHSEVRRPIEMILSRVVWYVFGVIVVLIGVRFVLKLFGANTGAGFVQFVYGLSGVFMAPFNTIFKALVVSGATFEWSALVAIAVYILVAWGVVALIRAVTPRESPETVRREQKDEDVRVP